MIADSLCTYVILRYYLLHCKSFLESEERLLEEVVVQGQRWLANLLESCVNAAVEDWKRRENGAVEVAEPLPHLTLQIT